MNDKIIKEFDYALLNYEKPSKFFIEHQNEQEYRNTFSVIYNLKNIKQDKVWHPEGNVFNHTMLVLDNAKTMAQENDNPYAFMLSSLCHDLGKTTTTYENAEGRIKATGHAKAGVPIATDFLFSIGKSEYTDYVCFMVKNHMIPNDNLRVEKGDGISDKGLFKVYDKASDYGCSAYALYCLAKCDELGKSYKMTEENISQTKALDKKWQEYEDKLNKEMDMLSDYEDEYDIER